MGMNFMNIGIIGSGSIGGTLGQHWAKAGHAVMFSSRNPEELKPLAAEVSAQTGTVQEAASFSDVILLAIPFSKILDLAQQIGRLDNKILIDATNPYPQRDGAMAQTIIEDALQTATGYVASQFPGAHTIKAFNSVYYKVLEEKAFRSGNQRIAIQVCGNDEPAKQTVKQLIEAIGFALQDLGGLTSGTIFEPDAPFYNKNLTIGEAEALLSKLSA
jgi:predicted dinucleotide-binding enzyme